MKKQLLAIGIAALILAGLVIYYGINVGPAKVRFEEISDKKIPHEIEKEVLPQYRDMERALACKAEDKVFVVVFRGEKPTTGYELEVDKLELENKDNKSNLKVKATFTDPENPEKLAHAISYPFVVLETDLAGLPDTIELQAEFAD